MSLDLNVPCLLLGWAEGNVLSKRQASLCRLLDLQLLLALCGLRPSLLWCWSQPRQLIHTPRLMNLAELIFSPWLASPPPGIF